MGSKQQRSPENNNSCENKDKESHDRRLVDYFMVVGYSDQASLPGATGSGQLLQRFPKKDWPDEPFIDNMEIFWQPSGWNLSLERRDPSYYMFVLTDTLGKRRYCACLCFYEKYVPSQCKTVDEAFEIAELEESESLEKSLCHHEEMFKSKNECADLQDNLKEVPEFFAPKVLCLVSNLNLSDTFRQCLGTIYTAFLERSHMPVEILVAHLLAQHCVPPPGCPPLRFSIGGGDQQIIQPPMTPTIPVTGSSVAFLVQRLGINNLLILFSAVITEHKILIYSRASSWLYDACGGCLSIMYPFRWLHTFIPLLPASLIDVVQSPTPFLIGVLTDAFAGITESLTDVLVVDLDGGSVIVPDNVSLKLIKQNKASTMPSKERTRHQSSNKKDRRGTVKETKSLQLAEEDRITFTTRLEDNEFSILRIPDILWNEAYELLCKVVQPELYTCDLVFRPLVGKPTQPFDLDKEVRAILLRSIAQLLQGYRSCLLITRIHPSPLIYFQQAKFLGGRGLRDNAFVIALLGTQAFSHFVNERGPPYRPVDIWDELYASLEEKSILEKEDKKLISIHVQELAEQLARNESPGGFGSKVSKPPDCVLKNNEAIFPLLNEDLVQEVLSDALGKQMNRYYGVPKFNQPKPVPFGVKVLQKLDKNLPTANATSTQHLEVLRTCVSDIFENRITSAAKTIHAVRRGLENRFTKVVMCEELKKHVTANVVMLERQQFELITQLMQATLKGTTDTAEDGIAALLLPLAMTFCRKLGPSVIQFAYTCIQDHPVWKNLKFWEASFYTDVEKDIVMLYSTKNDYSVQSANNLHIYYAEQKEVKPIETSCAMEIAADQLRLKSTFDADKLEDLTRIDESALYNQAVNYANRMVYLLTPCVAKKDLRTSNFIGDNASSVISVAETDSIGGYDSGVEFHDVERNTAVGPEITKFVCRFIDKVCVEGGATTMHMDSLNRMIPTVVEFHLDTVEALSRELERLPPIPKPHIRPPSFLPGEELVMEMVRALLLNDERHVGEIFGGTEAETVSNLNKTPLPAEGGVFLTNYRIIFKGYPLDQTVAIPVIIRCFPIASITKEKRFVNSEVGHKDQEGTLIRSAAFQVLKLAFEEEVNLETIELFRKLLHKLRYPGDILGYFAFAGQHSLPLPHLQSNKDKNSTFKDFAKKTLMMTAKKVGVKPRSAKKQKFLMKNVSGKFLGMTPGGTVPRTPTSNDGDDISFGSDDESLSPSILSSSQASSASDPKTLEKIMERNYAKDWKRLGFGGTPPRTSDSKAISILTKAESMRFSFVNASYTLSNTYPALVVVPQTITDESLRYLAQGFNYNRFPVVTWKHPRTKALLFRGSSINSKAGAYLRLFGAQRHAGMDPIALEFENYLRAAINATPGNVGRPESILGSDWSLDSALPNQGIPYHEPSLQNTPESGRKGSNPFFKAIDTLRTSGGKGKSLVTYKSMVAGKPKDSGLWRDPRLLHVGGSVNPIPPALVFSESQESRVGRRNLYIFMDKTKLKNLKAESTSRIEYIPMNNELGKLRSSFKQILRCCTSSNPNPKTGEGFWKGFERSEWLSQLQAVIRSAGAIIDLLDIQGSSVILCLGDGGDTTTQLSSIAQLCLDPYYRTMEGFNVLLEKEWVAFGHKFTERNGLGAVDNLVKDNIIPIFVQFLDIVNQIQQQYPEHFEFNGFYLKFLAYHSFSARFRTFLLDSECERVLLGLSASEEKQGSWPRQWKGVTETGSDDENTYTGKPNNQGTNSGVNIFDYISAVNSSMPLFFNLGYRRKSSHTVLRPVSDLSKLVPWEFFLEEAMSIGSCYEVELLNPSRVNFTDADGGTGDPTMLLKEDKSKNPRTLIMTSVDGVATHVVDSLTNSLYDPTAINLGDGRACRHWRRKIETLSDTSVLVSPRRFRTTYASKRGTETAHRKNTAKILLSGKLVRPVDLSPASTHHFEKTTFTNLAPCHVCTGILLGKVALECKICGITSHVKCMEGLSKCLGYVPAFQGKEEDHKGIGDDGTVTAISDMRGNLSMRPSELLYQKFKSQNLEDRTFEGFLYKRGALLKGWRRRWFVLDTTKHEIRYYETKEDPNSKGLIDLSEVKRIGKTDAFSQGIYSEKLCCFEIKTSKRIYHLAADDETLASDWIERIQGLLI